MRRDEEADLAGAALGVAVLGEDGVDKGAGAAFALCAGNVDDVKAIDVRRLFPSAHALEQREKTGHGPTHRVSDSAEIDAHLSHRRGIGPDPSLAPRLNDRVRRLQRVERINGVLSASSVAIFCKHAGDGSQRTTSLRAPAEPVADLLLCVRGGPITCWPRAAEGEGG